MRILHSFIAMMTTFLMWFDVWLDIRIPSFLDGCNFRFHAFPIPVKDETSVLKEKKNHNALWEPFIAIYKWPGRDIYLLLGGEIEQASERARWKRLLYRLENTEQKTLSICEVMSRPALTPGWDGRTSSACRINSEIRYLNSLLRHLEIKQKYCSYVFQTCINDPISRLQRFFILFELGGG